MARYLVTGGAGFIGSHLVDALLASGQQVVVLDDFSTGKEANLPPGIALRRGDVADPATVRQAMAGTDGCFHLAAIASVARGNEDWPGTHRVNVGGTVAVLDAARAAGGVPVVYASSAAIYGDTGEAVAHEALRPAPRTAYGADKLGSELHAAVGALVHGVPSIGLRFFNVYGPRQDPSSPYSGVISIFARRAAEGLGVTIHGDGEQTRDFVFVADVVAHLLAAMRRASNRTGADVFNVCTGRATSILQLATLLGACPVTHAAARAGDIRHSRGDPRRAAEALGVAATVELAAGLARLRAAS
ncbi:MAG: NAD-dependent epimerase/dehydratase family protein [Rhodospirillales bacterium]|nr:NAD-dependent epimerase/dehydratase family protein [Rhodospirillales bacterium]